MRSTSLRSICIPLGAALALLACDAGTKAVTEIIVTVDADGTLGLDALKIEVTGIQGGQSADADLTKSPLPRTLGIVHGGGPLGPIEVTATGLTMGAPVVSRTATVYFITGESLSLHLMLEAECAGVNCPDGETCAGGTCGDTDVPLGSGDGTGGTGDQGKDDAGPLAPGDGDGDAVTGDGDGDGDGAIIGDGLFCTMKEVCEDGVCTGGKPRDCKYLDTMCTIGVCNEDDDVCEAAPMTTGEPCDDGLFCTSGDYCQNGICFSGSQMDCSQFGADACNPGVCNETDRLCELSVATTGTSCGIGTCNAGICTDGSSCNSNQSCQLECTDIDCSFNCTNANNCEPTCSGSADCDIDCTNANNCFVDCRDESNCDIDCTRANNCGIRCRRGTSCAINCNGVDPCDAIRCDDGAACLLNCNNAETCEFSSCTGVVTKCANDIIVCGRSCPS